MVEVKLEEKIISYKLLEIAFKKISYELISYKLKIWPCRLCLGGTIS
jgi:hypothetical protein